VLSKTIAVILNGESGSGRSHEDIERLRKVFADAGLDARVMSSGPGEDLQELARQALEARPAALVAAGGDGTISALADAVRGTPTPLGVLPLGTLNHFARDLGIPLDPAQAARTIAQGRRVRVDVGEVNGRTFLNNASLGLYADMVRHRNRQQRRLRRSKRAAMLWASAAVLRRSPLVELRLELEEETQHCRAPFVFVGNNDYELEGFNIGMRRRLDAGLLNVYTTRRGTTAGLVMLALRAIFGRLRQADDFMESAVRSLRVDSPRRRLIVATDGEVTAMETPLEFRIRPRALEVIVP
jgi:diacylglycerol kinase family enzyme